MPPRRRSKAVGPKNPVTPRYALRCVHHGRIRYFIRTWANSYSVDLGELSEARKWRSRGAAEAMAAKLSRLTFAARWEVQEVTRAARE